MSDIYLGLDLGTTSLAGKLWDGTAEPLVAATLANPQQQYGADVITRMELARQGQAALLQEALVAGTNALVTELLQQAGARAGQICAAAVAANPAISHFLTGHPVDKILLPPHRPEYLAGEFLDSSALGLSYSTPTYLFPLITGYVGGDLLALLLGAPAHHGPTLYLDLGTNAELALWDGASWQVTSVAAGPAFEAGNLKCGMSYMQGAVTEVRIVKERFALSVAGGGMPKGLCGSGLFSLLDSSLRAGLIAADGRIRDPDEIDSSLSRYITAGSDGNILQVYRDARTCLQLTQADIRAFQLAKGAVRAGVSCLLQRAGLTPEQLVEVVIAGALGGKLPAGALKGVAILPEIVLEKCRFLPGSVLAGLLVFLQRPQAENQLKSLAAGLRPYPLSGTPAFEDAFLDSLDFLPERHSGMV